MFELCCDWLPQGDQPKAIEKLAKSIEEKKQYQTLLGVTGSGKTFVMANVIQKLQRPTIIMSHNKTLAAQLYSEFKSFFPKNAVEYFVSYYDFYQPEAYIAQRDIYIEKESSINEQLDKLRLSSTSSLLSRPDTIIVASVSCIYGLGDPEDYRSMVVRIEKNSDIERDLLLRQLVDIQYERNDIETSRGTFRVRGDTIEIYPSDENTAIRVEMFGDTIEKIVYIEPVSKEVLKEVTSVSIFPAKHFVTPAEKVEKAIDRIQTELKHQLKILKDQQKLLEASRLETRTLHDLEMLREVGYCSGVENYSRHFSSRKAGDRPACLLDYAPQGFLTFIDESHVTLPQIRGMYRGDRARKENLVNHGFRLPSALDNRPLKLDEWEAVTGQTVFVSATPNDYELEKSQHQPIELIIRPTGLLDPVVEVIPTENQVQDIIARIQEKAKSNERVLVTTLTKSLSEDLTDYMKDAGIKVAYLHCDIDAFERVTILQDLRKGKYDVVIGINLLREGLDLPEVSLVAILDADRQGFLRSETALIQTMGRAARNARAKVILYGDKITSAMKNAMEETGRRRKIQEAYNKKHGITPRDIHKEILSGIEEIQETQSELDNLVRESTSGYNTQEQINELEQQMMLAAQELNFELAAKLRDQLLSLKEGSGGTKNKRQKKRRRKR
ncbi:excinuclease ABC subunit UvrB [Candidatus Uabimicrobium sp. HlEnr_7]|uniref:excinuclease ABC subunit UvrB n=1 Tax=Candidatus Uabimicrobium helgolandensis TaxID=3095367 RepID=UPI0035580FAA